jgi:hypothetical protein
MFGHHDKDRPEGGQELAVDAHLEQDVGAVEQAIGAYLQDPADGPRRQLLGVLEQLDDQVAQGDAYDASGARFPVFGGAPRGTALGETGPYPIVEEVPGAEFEAQVALVKAAKNEVTAPSPGTLGALRSAWATLAAVRGQEPPAPAAR